MNIETVGCQRPPRISQQEENDVDMQKKQLHTCTLDFAVPQYETSRRGSSDTYRVYLETLDKTEHASVVEMFQGVRG